MNENKEDLNTVLCFTLFTYPNNIRCVSFALINLHKRKIQIGEFQDNDHYSNFESFLFQVNPQDNLIEFKLNILAPDNTHELEKLQEIYQQCPDIQTLTRDKKDFIDKQFELEFEEILIKPLHQYVQEIQFTRSLQCLASLVRIYSLQKDQGNLKKFQLETFYLNNFMKLDLAAINALSVFPKNMQELKKNAQNHEVGSLIQLLDKCKTQIGSRLLKCWIKQPLQDIQMINERLDKVQLFIEFDGLRDYLTNTFFKKIADLDKLHPKFYKVLVSQKYAGCTLQDCLKVYQLVTTLKDLSQYLSNNQLTNQQQQMFINSAVYEPLQENLQNFDKLEAMVEKCINLDKAKKNGVFEVNPTFSQQLQQINQNINKIRQKMDRIKIDIEEELDLQLTLIEHNTYSFALEGKKKETDEAFRKCKKGRTFKTISVKQKQMIFTTQELQSAVAEYNQFNEQFKQEQQEVVVATYHPAMESTALFIAELDIVSSFAQVAISAKKRWIRPELVENSMIGIRQSRHPILDQQLDGNVDKSCVENDCVMDKSDSRFHIITGPNMGGKSTYIRQVAICTLLAHIGCFVPAQRAKISIVDAIITRVGASDMQLKGISTFMSEMIEASCMLKTATDKSLVIIDELGRGTSTSEGFGIAWGISEYIANKIGCFCLFATHFHEMTKMEQEINGVQNYHVTCITKGDQLNFQYLVKKGNAERSYGLYVAEILKFPVEILIQASSKLKELEDFNEMEEENDGQSIFIPVIQFLAYEFSKSHSLEEISDLQQLGKLANLKQKQLVINAANELRNLMKDIKDQGLKQQMVQQMKSQIVKILQGKK